MATKKKASKKVPFGGKQAAPFGKGAKMPMKGMPPKDMPMKAMPMGMAEKPMTAMPATNPAGVKSTLHGAKGKGKGKKAC